MAIDKKYVTCKKTGHFFYWKLGTFGIIHIITFQPKDENSQRCQETSSWKPVISNWCNYNFKCLIIHMYEHKNLILMYFPFHIHSLFILFGKIMQIWHLYFNTFDLISILAVERFKIRTEKDSFLVSIFGWTKRVYF